MRLDNIVWFTKFLDIFKIRVNQGEVVEVVPKIIPIIDVLKSYTDVFKNGSRSDTGNAILVSAVPNTRFVMTGLNVQGISAVTDGQLSITGYCKGTNVTVWTGYSSVTLGPFNEFVSFSSPIIFDVNTAVTFTVGNAGTGSLHTAIVSGFYI